MANQKLIRELITPGAAWPNSLSEEQVFGFCCDVSDLFTQEGANEIVGELVRVASEHDIPIYRTGEAPHEKEQSSSGSEEIKR